MKTTENSIPSERLWNSNFHLTETKTFSVKNKLMQINMWLQLLLVLLLLSFNSAKAEDFDVQLTPSLYAGGYNISCHGANTGSISLFISGGNAPYTFVWLDGPTIRNRGNLTAGYYRVVVTASNGASVIREITLKEPDIFQVTLQASEFEGGYNLPENGASNAKIDAIIEGGVPPYTYLWSNGKNEPTVDNLAAGNYSVTVHDATNCTATSTVTLTEPTTFHLVSITSPFILNSIYNTTACRKMDGNINLIVAGGTPPYKFQWSNGAFTQNLTDIAAGDYAVIATDANGAEFNAAITLTSSPEVKANFNAFVYSNGKNTSCYSCSNGSIASANVSGLAPYTYVWNNGLTTAAIQNLASGIYHVILTDALGCSFENDITLVAPDREDWTMSGNSNTNPNTQFIGSTDAKDVVFKTNNNEALRLLSSGGVNVNGELKIANPSANSGMLFIDNNGKLVNSEAGNLPLCNRVGSPIWNTNQTENSIYTCAPTKVGIGTHIFPNAITFHTIGNSLLEGDLELGTTSDNYLLNINGQAKISTLGGNSNPMLVQTDNGGLLSAVAFPSKENLNYWQLHSNTLDVFRPSGNVGIGAINPSAELEIAHPNTASNAILNINKQTGFGAIKNLVSLKNNGEFRIGCDGSASPWFPALYISPLLSGENYTEAKVGISTNEPSAQFQVGNRIEKVALGSFYSGAPFYNGSYIGFNAGRDKATAQWTIDNDGSNSNGASIIASGLGGELRFITLDASLSGEVEAGEGYAPALLNDGQILDQIKMVVRPDGKVGIGQPSNYNGNYKLYVKGGILADKVKVAVDGSPEWMDIVFDKNYKLRNLKELETYIENNKHLPEIPTTSEVVKDGIDLGFMQKKTLQKIEELTLYIIAQNKRIEELENVSKK